MKNKTTRGDDSSKDFDDEFSSLIAKYEHHDLTYVLFYTLTIMIANKLGETPASINARHTNLQYYFY